MQVQEDFIKVLELLKRRRINLINDITSQDPNYDLLNAMHDLENKISSFHDYSHLYKIRWFNTHIDEFKMEGIDQHYFKVLNSLLLKLGFKNLSNLNISNSAIELIRSYIDSASSLVTLEKESEKKFEKLLLRHKLNNKIIDKKVLKLIKEMN